MGGNAVSVLGDSHSSGSGASVPAGSGSAGGSTTSGEDGVLGGNQVTLPVSVPVTVGGNAVSVVGDSTSAGGDSSGSVPAGSGSAGGSTTSGEDGVLGGNQVTLPVSVPVTVGGNAVSVLGDSHSSGSSASVPAGSGSAGGSATSGEDGVLGGNQVTLPVSVPVTVGGNAVAVVGDSTTDGPTTTTPGGETPGGGTPGSETPGHETPGATAVGDATAPVGSLSTVTADVPAALSSRLAQTGMEGALLLQLAFLLLLAGGGLVVAARRPVVTLA
ncbi:chaplin family protein [Phycicoccus duodecadis]|uniref:chaplin family protein n=1 Tax=Phycicoccus duodecadis TaxID=173053 RepID=UPI0013045DB5|nr:chaplin family protein [Phycicoccus duodecadis]